MGIELTDEAIERLSSEIRQFFVEEFDRDLSDFQARRLIDFFKSHLAPPVYNQAIQDARKFFQEKVDDLDGEFYEPDPRGES